LSSGVRLSRFSGMTLLNETELSGMARLHKMR
jgi:hypothetical protein